MDTRQDSMANKEVVVDDGVESITEDTETGSHTDEATNQQAIDLEKSDARAAPSEPLRRVVTAQDWTGPDDPENPLNWYDFPPAIYALQ